MGGALVLGANAQDRRDVTQPTISPVCTTLGASVSAVKNNTGLAEADEQNSDTQRIQKAIDACSPGHAVELRASGEHNAFVSGALYLRGGVTLLVDANTVLFASRNPREFDAAPGACGVVDHNGRGCKGLINADHATNSGVLGDGVIDGRGGEKLLGQNASWWDLAEQARGDDLRQNCPRLLVLDHADNFVLYRITLKNSPNFHVAYTGGHGFTVWGVAIDTPKTARNTDGIDPISATDVTIAYSYIHAGDDNVAIKAGDAGPASHITVAHNHFYTGHGMSIGSETNGGVNAVRVTDLSIDGADNGIRIKSNSSRGGVVQDVEYQDVCIRDTKNPILMDTHYSFYGNARDKIPVFTDILLRDVRMLGGGKLTFDGYDGTHRLGMRLDGVGIDPPQEFKVAASHADVTLGPGPVNFSTAGDDVRVVGQAGRVAMVSCAEKFVPMPVK
jgi:polygalacturonase